MSDKIDPYFVAQIVEAKRRGDLKIEPGYEGATLHFTMRSTKMTMHLGADNWAVVQAALAEIES